MQFIIPLLSVGFAALLWLCAGIFFWEHNLKQTLSCLIFASYCTAVAWVTWPY